MLTEIGHKECERTVDFLLLSNEYVSASTGRLRSV